ncbi:hypothetical protein Pelo_18786 [Pelomyxa schiedti]|nr:hypothetical protein Pelo_18786 [Pelomyxa schiedti]
MVTPIQCGKAVETNRQLPEVITQLEKATDGSDCGQSEDQIASSKSELATLSKRCLDQKSKVDVAMQQLENVIASVEQKHAAFQAEVNKVGTNLKDLLRNRTDLLNQQSSDIWDKKVERLNQQKSVLTTISEYLGGAYSCSLSAMNSSSNDSLISAQKLCSETLQVGQKHPIHQTDQAKTVEGVLSNPERLNPCEVDGIYSILDKTACCEAISSLGVVLPPEEAIGTPGQPRLCQSTATSLSLLWNPPPTKAAILTGYTLFLSLKQQEQQKLNQQQEEQDLHCLAAQLTTHPRHMLSPHYISCHLIVATVQKMATRKTTFKTTGSLKAWRQHGQFELNGSVVVEAAMKAVGDAFSLD